LKSKELNRIGNSKFQLAEFSPNGSFVSFVRENNVFIYNLESKKEIAVTTDGVRNSIINGAPDWVYEEEFTLVKAYEWSHDSKCIAYYRFDESNVREYSFPMYGTLYPENYVYKYPKAGEDNSEVSVIIYHLESKKQVPVKTKLSFEYIPRIQWVSSNDMLSIQFMNRLQNQVNIELADRNTGLANTLFQDNSDTYLDVQDIYYFKNKNAFILLRETTGNNQIYYFEFDVSQLGTEGNTGVTLEHQYTKGDNVVTNLIGVNEKAGVLYYQLAKKGQATDRHTMRLNLNVKNQKPAIDMSFPTGYAHIESSEGYKYFIVYSSSSTQPLTVKIHSENGEPVRTLEDNKVLQETLSNYDIKYKEFFKFKNRNGDELDGWMIKPQNFDPSKKYPVLMYVYGGPGSQTVRNSWGGANFMWYQYLAQKGYIIVSVDNRGTGGRSRDFRACTYEKLGKYETEDQIDAVKYLAGTGFVDQQRIGIWGWSYGGYMSTLCLSKGADLFKMAIAVAPVSNWRYYDSIYTERYMGIPSENGKSYDENSPINHVEKIKGKYLLVHGTGDDNVHYQNTTELITALVEKDVQFDLAIYPNKNHSIYGGNTRYHLYTKMSDFIFENL